ncbi:Yippee/Mis18 [Radiomyces spectabilis]|uniref:Yippee/Mis18 n=1 Tax=Radiomyces spectabilis TaxID=64574 RepID=UPI0022203438|nr:Yippee/Mis18 [Radiomyces spectabilis]KAI8369281.1 Yippee/Mis18 [Radiomyces spectabilis]
MGLKYRTYLEGITIYGCHKCKTHLSTEESIISSQFQGQHGQAYLTDNVVNITRGKAVDLAMATGIHTIRNISCAKCDTVVGWVYIKAFNEENRYKEGKFILESKMLTTVD